MKKILVPVRGDGKGDNVVAHAVALARGFHAHVQITHCRLRPQDLIPFGVAVPALLKEQIISQSEAVSDLTEAGLRDEIIELARQNNATMADAPDGKSVTMSFVEEEGRQIDVIRHHGLLADLTAVAKPDYERNLGTNTLQAALFSTGRPVMMCPEPTRPVPATLGQTITIAWDGSVEASRAVALTLPLLQAAKKVFVLTNTSEAITVGPDEICAYLLAQGVKASVEPVDSALPIGASLHSISEELNADFMVLGAYSTNKNLERIAGGVTQYMIDHATLPVVFAN